MSGYFPPANVPEGTTWTHPSGRVFLLRGGHWVDAPTPQAIAAPPSTPLVQNPDGTVSHGQPQPQAFTPPPSTPLVWDPSRGVATHGNPAPQVPVSTPAPPSTPMVAGPNGATHGTPGTTPTLPAAPRRQHGGFRPMDETAASYYDKVDRNGVYRQFVDFFGDPNSQRGRYAQEQFGNAQAAYTQQAETDEGMLFPDFLTSGYWQQMMDTFGRQGFEQRGEAPPVLGARGNSRIVW